MGNGTLVCHLFLEISSFYSFWGGRGKHHVKQVFIPMHMGMASEIIRHHFSAAVHRQKPVETP